jgi:hypothetical protein
MMNNYEYVDDTCNHANTVLIVGNGTCTTNFTNPDNQYSNVLLQVLL